MTEFTLVFSRIELNWLYRQLCSGRDKAEAILEGMKGPVELSAEQKQQQIQTIAHFEELKRLTQMMRDRLETGERERLQIQNLRADLEEAFDLAEEESAKQEVMNRLKALPKEEPYRITFDRETCKFTLKLVEQDLHKFRTEIIPTYENTDVSEFEDPIQTKTFWVNKARKSKDILEKLKTKLEKAL